MGEWASTGWDGKERRSDMTDLILELKGLQMRFDNELGSGKNGDEGSVKRHMRNMSEKIDRLCEVILGDGKDYIGVAERMNIMSHDYETMTNDLKNHSNSDRWLFGVLITLQLAILGKMIVG